MKKSKFFTILLIIFLTSIVGASNFCPVSAAVATITEHENAFGSTIIAIEGHPQIRFDCYHFDYGTLGSGDVIRVWYYTGLPSPLTYVPVAIFTDNPARASFLQEFYIPPYLPTSIQLVKPSDIETSREGNSKTIMAVWKTNLEAPSEIWGSPGHTITVPAITIPPGRIIFRGHGDIITGTSTTVPTYPGQVWTQTLTWTGYYGDATFVSPTWHFGGPVGLNEGQLRTNVRLDAMLVSTKP